MPELYIEVYKLFQNKAMLKKKKDKTIKICAMVYKQSEKLDLYDNLGRRILSDNDSHLCFQ